MCARQWAEIPKIDTKSSGIRQSKAMLTLYHIAFRSDMKNTYLYLF
jgi:hypothetical protein